MKNHEKIKVLFLDIDGTLTDGKIHISQDGELYKSFNVKDGYALNTILKEKNIIPVILTGRESEIVRRRCAELGISNLYQGISNKLGKMNEILNQEGLSLAETAYIGDDLNDYECMKIVKIKGCPKDAAKEIIAISDFISEKCGGDGAVREFIEWL